MAATMPSPSSPPSNAAAHRDRAASAEKRTEHSRGGKSIAMELAPRRACSDVGHHRRSSATAFNGAPRIKNRVRTADLEQLRFILECFFLSFGPECPQLGRNHPNSDPERYAAGRQQQQQPAQPHYRRRSSVDSASASSASTCSTIRSSSSSSSSSSNNTDQLPSDYDHDALLREVLRLFEAGLDGNGGPVLLRHQHIAELASMSIHARRRGARTSLHRRTLGHRRVRSSAATFRCHQFVSRDEISARLPADSKDHFHRLLVTANVSTKTCPPLQPRHPASQTRQPAAQVRRVRRVLVLRLPRALARGPQLPPVPQGGTACSRPGPAPRPTAR
ncbi:hypothetical protein MTO96_025035 [Rhipicephalus appendiculatus]